MAAINPGPCGWHYWPAFHCSAGQAAIPDLQKQVLVQMEMNDAYKLSFWQIPFFATEGFWREKHWLWLLCTPLSAWLLKAAWGSTAAWGAVRKAVCTCSEIPVFTKSVSVCLEILPTSEIGVTSKAAFLGVNACRAPSVLLFGAPCQSLTLLPLWWGFLQDPSPLLLSATLTSFLVTTFASINPAPTLCWCFPLPNPHLREYLSFSDPFSELWSCQVQLHGAADRLICIPTSLLC